jgi:hypothetical protein
MQASNRFRTKASGFQNNAQLFDETTWKTESNLHSDMQRTEYRTRYNQDKPFHKTCLLNSHGRLNQPERFRVYDKIENNPNTNWEIKAFNHTKNISMRNSNRGLTIEN